MRLGYEGRVVVVTGAGQGLGRSHARKFARRGAHVLVNDLGGGPAGGGADGGVAEALAAEIRAAGGSAAANADSVEDGGRIVQAALDRFGRIDVLVNNAGILRDAAFHKMTEEDWGAVHRVHLLGAFRTTAAAWPHMRAAGYGRIVMTASAAGVYGNFGQANYSAAKLGLHGLAQTLAVEGAAKGIRVNTVAPIAASRLTAGVMPQAMLDALRPEAVTPLLVALCHESCERTGQLFEASGGWISRVRWEQSQGAFLDGNFAAEDVEARWAEIDDFTGARHGERVGDTVAELGRRLGLELALSPQP